MKKHKILFAVLTVFVIGIATLVYFQFGNIKALYYSFKYDKGQISDMDSENQQLLESVLNDNPDVNVRPTTDAEDKLHGEGFISDDELVSIITGKTTVAEIFGQDVVLNDKKNLVLPDGTAFTKDTAKQMRENRRSGKDNAGTVDSKQTDMPGTDDSKQNNTSNSDEKVSACVAQMYVLRSTFCSKLDGIYSQAVSYYKSLPGEKADKASVVKKFYSSASALEGECDGKVEALLSELESALKSSGQDTSMVGKIREYYNNEKAIKKAQYINMYKNN